MLSPLQGHPNLGYNSSVGEGTAAGKLPLTDGKTEARLRH